MRDVHERMPVILTPDSWERWLTSNDKDSLQTMLVPYSGKLDIDKVSRAVNSPKNDGPELIEPL